MQAKRRTQPYEYFDPVFDGGFEAPIDAEYSLPDYLPDIQKILKCHVTPEISSYLITEDVLSCDGVCDVRVLYLDAKGDRLRCCDFTKEFSASVKIRSTAEKAVAWVRAAISHSACRAVSARRIDLHLTVSLKALTVVQKRDLIPCGIEEETIEKRTRSLQASRAVNALCHQFTVEDTLTLRNGKPPIESILRKDVCCRISDQRLSEGKLTVSGVVDLCFLYLSSVDGATVEKMSASLDFSQSIDCAGAGEDCICDLKAVLGESSLLPREDDMGEYTAVDVTARVFLTVFLYQPCEVEIVDDAYSTGASMEMRYEQTQLTQLYGVRTELLKKKCSITVPEESIEKILDIWCEQDSVQSVCDKGKLSFRVRYTICMVYVCGQGRIACAESTFDYNAAADAEDSLPRKTETASHTELWEYRITDKNTVELSVETTASVLLSGKTAVKYLYSIEMDENAKEAAGPSRLLVYYASPGESLWEIAKSHAARLEDIRSQNDLYDEAVSEARPLIICNR